MIRDCYLLHDLLADIARERPAAIAMTSRGTAIRYDELAQRSDALARTLADIGVERGDRVVIFTDNGIDAVVAFWAVLKANAVVVIVHPQIRSSKLDYLLADSRARAMIVDPHLPFTGPAASSRHLRSVLVTGTPGWQAVQAMGAPPARRCNDLDLAAILHASGPTGVPGGVMLTHRNMLAATASISEYFGIRSDDVILCVLSLAFDYGLYQMTMSVAAGARLVLERSNRPRVRSHSMQTIPIAIQTTNQLREFVTSKFYIPATVSFDDTSSLVAQGIIDSTGVLELVSFVEDHFGISVQDDELVPDNFDSLAALGAYVERKRA